jgi:hypothetical protein
MLAKEPALRPSTTELLDGALTEPAEQAPAKPPITRLWRWALFTASAAIH